MRIIKLKLRYWWNNADLLHYTAIIILGFVIGACLCYALGIAVAPFIHFLNSH